MNIRKRDAETTGVKPPDKALNQPTRYGETKMTQKFRKSVTIINLSKRGFTINFTHFFRYNSL